MKDTPRRIRAGYAGPSARTVNPPLHRGSTVLFDSYQDLARANAGQYDGITYGTDRLPAQRAFEEDLCALEGGRLTRAFQSGISAIINTFLAFTKADDQVLLCDNVYGPGKAFCQGVLAKFGVEIGTLPSNVGADIVDYLKPNTRLLLLESPGSHTLEIQDVPAVTAVARERGIVTVLDNTWATPLFLKPFELGVDVSIQSATKYIAGHSDVLLGTVTVSERHASELDRYCRTTESFASPEDCYLALRGLKSLAVRLRQHERSALEIARWLERSELVDQVIHPALPSHPEHARWERDFTGSSGLFSFTLKEEPSQEQLAAFIDGLELFGIGYSWGGFQSLITAGRYARRLPSRYAGRTIVRLSVGLEDAQDLIGDLERGLDRLGASRPRPL
jgi:cystathionine beta-lyase